MKRYLFVLFLLLAACSGPITIETPGSAPPLELPTQGEPVDTDDPNPVARAYLDAWKAAEYGTMYAWLTPLSKDAISEADFVTLHRGMAGTMNLVSVEYNILATLAEGQTAHINYEVVLESKLVGPIQRLTTMSLSWIGEQWRVQWDRGLILPELSGGNALMMDYRTPARGNIYDRLGRALVAQTDAVSIGVISGRLDPDREAELFSELSVLTGLTPGEIAEKIAAALDGWYVPLAEVSSIEVGPRLDYLNTFEGLVLEPYRSRYYFDGGIAPQVIGYVSLIQPEELVAYQALGYRQDDRVGRTGLEQWGEAYLSGAHGGSLYVITPGGDIITKLAEGEPVAAQTIYTTLDLDLQKGAEAALEGFTGAAVVLERDTGRILAMASSPSFDPNLFEPSNFNSDFLLTDLLTDSRTPILNRATQGQYPLGSVFKIITMAAGLESGLYTPESSYYCAQTFNELAGVTRYDWTYAWGVPASGLLTLPEGLMRSCNPWFWHIGLDLYNQGFESQVSDMARGFGLGELVGLEQLVESPGQIPTPISAADALNLAIGQGDTQVSPLQVANFIAAIGNGGDIMLPQVIERIERPDGSEVFSFVPQVLRALPISPETLAALQDGLDLVVQNSRGTAYWRFINFPVHISGKTGTAEAPPNDPHAWFAGYTNGGPDDRPDIAAVVLLEHAGEGSQVAAPIWKRIAEIYYFGAPVTALPWETEAPVPSP
jgi:penicillin-binding protein 2